MNKRVPVLIAALGLLATVAATADDLMPTSRAQALAMEAQDALPLTRFYEPPPFGERTPGTLIRSVPFNGYSLPPGAHAMRILYVSRALDGARDAVSGVVLIPAGSPPRDGWPVIVWRMARAASPACARRHS